MLIDNDLFETTKQMFQQRGINIFRLSLRYFSKNFEKLYRFIIEYKTTYNLKNCTAECIYVILNRINDIPICEYCHKEKCMFDKFENGFKHWCPKCGKKNGISIAMENYKRNTGFSNPIKNPVCLQNRKRNNKRKTGYEEVLSDPKVINKWKNTQRNNGGVGFSRKSIIDKANNTLFERKHVTLKEYPATPEFQLHRRNKFLSTLGFDSWMASDIGRIIRFNNYWFNPDGGRSKKEKAIRLLLETYGYQLIASYKDCFSMLNIRCNKCGYEMFVHPYRLNNHKNHITNLCPICNPELSWYLRNKKSFRSTQEIEIEKYIKNNIDNCIINSNDRRLLETGKEIDIYLPNHKIAIEYNGLWWHGSNEYVSAFHSAKTSDYHYSKYKICKDKGIRLLTIFENEYLNDKEYYLDRILKVINENYDFSDSFIQMDNNYYMIDNRFNSYEFLNNKDDYELVSELVPQKWFFAGNLFLHEQEFQYLYNNYLTDYNSNEFIANNLEFNWIYDCGYQIIKPK